MTKEYLQTRKPYTPEVGRVYENEGGGFYRCLNRGTGRSQYSATMVSVKGWMFIAHGLGIYEDGKIDWTYSTGGIFIK